MVFPERARRNYSGSFIDRKNNSLFLLRQIIHGRARIQRARTALPESKPFMNADARTVMGSSGWRSGRGGAAGLWDFARLSANSSAPAPAWINPTTSAAKAGSRRALSTMNSAAVRKAMPVAARMSPAAPRAARRAPGQPFPACDPASCDLSGARPGDPPGSPRPRRCPPRWPGWRGPPSRPRHRHRGRSGGQAPPPARRHRTGR